MDRWAIGFGESEAMAREKVYVKGEFMFNNSKVIPLGQIQKKIAGFLKPEKRLHRDYDVLSIDDLVETLREEKKGRRIIIQSGETLLNDLRNSIAPNDKENFFMIQSLLAGNCLVKAAIDKEDKVDVSSVEILRAIQFDDKVIRLLEKHQGTLVMQR